MMGALNSYDDKHCDANLTCDLPKQTNFNKDTVENSPLRLLTQTLSQHFISANNHIHCNTCVTFPPNDFVLTDLRENEAV